MFTLDKRNILESLTTAVLITDKTFIIEYANTAAEQLCGISRSRLVNHCATNLIDRSEETLLKTLQETDPNFTIALGNEIYLTDTREPG